MTPNAPRVISTPTPAAKLPIGLPEALRSTLRAWLALRDSVVWLFCSGVESPGLDEFDASGITSHVASAIEQMNNLRASALGFASQIASRGESPQNVIAETMTELLRAESPKFLLHVDGIDGAF